MPADLRHDLFGQAGSGVVHRQDDGRHFELRVEIGLHQVNVAEQLAESLQRVVLALDGNDHLPGGGEAVAGLIKDLKSRGLLAETLVLWAGEFGRTPHAAGRDGRDHHPEGFSVWLAGGGVKGGTAYGATDEMGMHAVENVVTMHDLHATVLHLLGLDHERLTYRFGGRDFRLTDVHGRVVGEIIA